ncbi:arsinothricin resistance N-acetyltransferase ArsN1 family A [Saccharibacillus deserti]|uniref:arsinothricin resistance N-acetyltransferase ArsN1 family A n=1 Tax=Saccharibacillus deserti TaxID=1634444 RepID=UPI00155710D3|nr:arsinothricin resistance N-acetyltransferase ArsN1 family A [Saccharibacillus deserti]
MKSLHTEHSLSIRPVREEDLEAVLHIYNQGIEDRIATLETEAKPFSYIEDWFGNHQGRYLALAAERRGEIVGWAALNPYSQRCAYDGVADLSIYVGREHRGTGVGTPLLSVLEEQARRQDFRKIVLFTLPFNEAGQRLYRKSGYRIVGTFEKQGMQDGREIDVMIMEKRLGSGEDARI